MVRRRPSVTAPVIDPLVLTHLTDADVTAIEPPLDHHGLRFVDLDLSGQNLCGIEFLECAFDGFSVGEADLRGARFVDTRIERLDAPVLSAARSSWRNVRISGSRIGAAELPEADVRTLAIAGSKLDFVNLRSAQIRDVEFVECRIGELDLGQAQLERVAFRDCVVEHLRLDGVRSRALDLRGATLGVLSGLDAARGVLISGLQATELAEQFAAHLGFTLAD